MYPSGPKSAVASAKESEKPRQTKNSPERKLKSKLDNIVHVYHNRLDLPEVKV